MIFLLIFLFVFVFNIAPVFTPPTWMILSYLEVVYHPNPFSLALVGAIAATLGRLTLAKLAKVIIRDRFLSKKTLTNLNTLRDQLQHRRKLTFSIFLLYAFGPLPSNQLFLAYGLTDLELSLIALPFFLGRFASYLFWIITASEITHKLAAQTLGNGSFIKSYFLSIQVLTLVVIYIFTKIDWQELFQSKRIQWLK